MLKEPIIKTPGKLKMVGMNFYGDPFVSASMWSEENGIGLLWKRFGSWLSSRGYSVDNAVQKNLAYEVHIGSEQMEDTGQYEVFTGIEVTSLESVPVECVAKVFPDVAYAQFTLEGDEITSDWMQWIYEGWMPHSGYEPAGNYSMQVYDETFKGMDKLDGVKIDVLVPVKKVGDA